MKTLTAVLLAAGAAFADPRHTEEDLVEDLRPLAWLLGTWTAEGELAGLKYHEDIRYWPDLDGHVLIERAIVKDEDNNVLHEDRIVFWTDRDGLHAVLLERPPVGASALAVKLTEKGFALTPAKEGGPSLAFTKSGADGYEYVYEAKDAKNNAVKATGIAKRTKRSYPDIRHELALPLAAAELALGRFSGSGGEPAHPIRETQRGCAILGGEVLQLRITQKHKEGDLKLRFFAWPESDGRHWQALLFSNAELNGVTMNGTGGKDALELEVPARKPSAGSTFRWAWTLDAYEWSLGSFVDPRLSRTFKGKRVR